MEAITPEAYIAADFFLDTLNIESFSTFIPRTGKICNTDVIIGRFIFMRLDLPTK
ncbi:MAG: hypothetical protein QXF28_06660 [Nitrososphaerota archaeon]